MKTDTLEKAKQLSPEKQQEVEDFIDYLFNKYNVSNENIISVAEKRKKNMGWARGKIWIADNFNDTPEDFKEYL
jgi:hypothetical protein